MERNIWGDFELTEILGKGGMGIVYKGRQISLDREVAVKVLPASLTQKKDFVERFYREAKAIAKLNCPQIIQVYGAGDHEGKHYFAMEFINGEDLAEKLQRGDLFEIQKILFVIRETAEALAKAGEKNIIHRDIKPANIMITKKGEIKIMDFGLAKFITDGDDITQAGVVMGTVNYLSPEQGQGKRCDQRTDIYSLGVVMYELLTGKVPFQGENPSSVIYQHIHTKPPLPSELNNSVPKDVEAVVMKCLRKDPNQRYFSASELVKDIEAIEAGKAPKTGLIANRKMVMKRGNKIGLVLIIVMVLSILIAGVLGWVFKDTPLVKSVTGKVAGLFGVDDNKPSSEDIRKRQEEEQKRRAEEEQRRQERRQEEEKRQKLEIELKAIEEKMRTNNVKELKGAVRHLTQLQAENPENERISILIETVASKIGTIEHIQESKAEVEKYLKEKQFDEAEKLAAELLRRVPDDLILKSLYTKVQNEKESYLHEKKRTENIEKELTGAKKLYEMGSFELALEKFKDVLRLDPANAVAAAKVKECEAKIREMKSKAQEKGGEEDRKVTQLVLTADQHLAISQCANYYNAAEDYFNKRDFINATLYVERTLAVEGIDHIPAAIELKKRAIELRIKIEMALREIQEKRALKERIATLKKMVEEKIKEGDELAAINALNALVEVDPDNKDKYLERIEEIYVVYDRKKVVGFVSYVFNECMESEDLDKILGSFDREALGVYERQKEEFTVFFETFSNIESNFFINSLEFSKERKKCKVKGRWDIAFFYDHEGIESSVSYEADLFLIKRNDTWNINGMSTQRKEKE